MIGGEAREAVSELAGGGEGEALGLMDPDSGDPAVAGDMVDSESQAVADTGHVDPDAGPTAEEAAMHIVEAPDGGVDTDD